VTAVVDVSCNQCAIKRVKDPPERGARRRRDPRGCAPRATRRPGLLGRARRPLGRRGRVAPDGLASSSRDVRSSTEVAGDVVTIPVAAETSVGEFYANPLAAAALTRDLRARRKRRAGRLRRREYPLDDLVFRWGAWASSGPAPTTSLAAANARLAISATVTARHVKCHEREHHASSRRRNRASVVASHDGPSYGADDWTSRTKADQMTAHRGSARLPPRV
jgi:hypothetical protein